MKQLTLFIIGFLMFVVLATVDSYLDRTVRRKRQRTDSTPIELKLSVQPRFIAHGDSAKFTLTVKNKTYDTLKFTLRTPVAAIFAVKKDGVTIWDSMHGKVVAQVITPFILAPGKEKSMYSWWNARDNAGKYVMLGKYTVEACFLGSDTCIVDSVFVVD